MKNTLMIAVSALTIAIAVPAYAQMNAETNATTNATVSTTNNSDVPAVETTTEAEIEQNWEATKETVSDAWTNTKETVSETAAEVSESVSETYEETAASFDADVDVDAYLENDAILTADKLIGANIINAQDEKIAEIEDIIVTQDGQVAGVIVSNGGFLGLGKKTSIVDMNQLSGLNADGDIMTSMTTDAFRSAPAYSAPSNTVANGQFRLSSLLNADITNPANESLASIDDIIIENGQASKVVFSTMSGLAPKAAIMNFSDANLSVNTNNKPTLRISASEVLDFNTKMTQ